jgi:rhodanese-related sulfurtransferase
MASPTQITPAQLSRLIGTPDCPVLIDLCIDEDFDENPRLIPGATRHDFLDMDGLAAKLNGAKPILYCKKGLKISQGAVALLRNKGIAAEALEGGHFAWRDAGLPMVRNAAIPPRNSLGQTVWVTRQRPKIDRIACAWLIRRFVDPSAQFLFVEPAQVLNVADYFTATPFDFADVHFSHRGDKCTFDTMLSEFELDLAPLNHLANIIRAADTNRHADAPEAAGLLAASLGLSRMYRDDVKQLDAGLALYDAFYRWARDATDEGHDWPVAPK